MENKTIQGKTIKEWEEKYPLMSRIISTDEVFWTNSKYEKFEAAIKKISLSEKDVEDAEERLNRFAPYIAKVFPETQKTNGIIESPIVPIPNMQSNIAETYNQEILGQLLLKCDSNLAISGSIKARGGIYEVLKHAEDLAIENNMLTIKDDYSIMD
ncbi:D-serine ammonia-lyase, partial [Neobacillus drentensis]